MKLIITLLLIGISICSNAQGWTYSEEFGTDFWTGSLDVKFVDTNKGRMSVLEAGNRMREEAIYGGFVNPTLVKGYSTNTSDIYAKVSAQAQKSSPQRTSYNTKPTSSAQARRMGKNYNYQTTDEAREWIANRQQQIQEAREREAERKRQEELARKIADDNRAAAVTAQTNALLQAQTNRRIERDHYHANEGAYAAQQRAHQAYHRTGPQFNRNKSMPKNKAQMLRGQAKPRRVMYPQTQKRNIARKQLAQVQRRPLPSNCVQSLKKATRTRTEFTTRKNTKGKHVNYVGFVLDENAVPTTGRDWQSDDLKQPPLPPPPISKVNLTEDDLHALVRYEILSDYTIRL